MYTVIGRSSSEEVVLQLINSKCMPCLIFIKTLFIVNSNDLSCVLLIGQASSAYNKVYCMHLKLVQLIKRKKSHWNLL